LRLSTPAPSVLERSCIVDAPIAEVFAFHLDTRNAARIAPPGQQVLSVEGTFPLRLDSEVRLRVRQLPSPWAQTWLVRVVQLEEPTLVVDEMLRGPFPAWRHEHRFAELPDGCTRLTAFLKIVLPAAAPGLVATFVYAFLFAWDELLFVAALTQSNAETIPIGIRNFIGNYNSNYDQLMAASVVATIPVVIAFYAVQRWLVRGITAGAVKG